MVNEHEGSRFQETFERYFERSFMSAQRSPRVPMSGSGDLLKTLFIFDESQVGSLVQMQFLAL